MFQERNLYSLIPRKLLTEMLKSNFRKLVLFCASLICLCITSDAQNQYEFTGNVTVKNTVMMEAIKGFYSYITDKKIEKINSSDYYVKVNLSSTNDSTDYFEISLYSYAITNLEKKPNSFYGYLKRDNIYFVFSTAHKLIAKNSKMNNPKLFKSVNISGKQYPKPPYDPYRWEFLLCKNKVIQKNPSDVIEKFVVLK